MKLAKDGSSNKKVTLLAVLFMGLSHIVCFKQYLKGAIYALCEVCFIVCIPWIIGKLSDLITLGSPQPNIPIKDR